MKDAYRLIKIILAHLFTAEERRLEQFIVDMQRSNREATGITADGFVHGGQYFRPQYLAAGTSQKVQLHQSLQPEMDRHLADRKVIEDDKQLISQLLYKLLEPCGYNGGSIYQDIRDTLPECVQDTLKDIPQVHDLDRIRTPGYTLNHERDFKLYARVLPKIEFYSAARLLY